MNIEEFKSLRSNLSKKSGADELKEIVDDLLSFYEDDQENVTNIENSKLEIVVDYTNEISIVSGYLSYDLVTNDDSLMAIGIESQNLEKFLKNCENINIKKSTIRYSVWVGMKEDLYDLDMETPSYKFVKSVEDHMSNLKQLYLRCKSENIEVLLECDDLMEYTEKVLEQIDFIRGDIDDPKYHTSAHDDHTDNPLFGFESFYLEFSKEIDPKSLLLTEDPSKLVPKNIITDFNQFLSKFNFSNRDKSNLINIIKRGNWSGSLNENLSSSLIRK